MKGMFVGPSTEFKLKDIIEFARTVKTHYFVPFAVIVPPAMKQQLEKEIIERRITICPDNDVGEIRICGLYLVAVESCPFDMAYAVDEETYNQIKGGWEL